MYMAAIKQAVEGLTDEPPDEQAAVLDIGTGTGLLAMQAASCRPGWHQPSVPYSVGARVVACEMAGPMAKLAEQLVDANNLQRSIQVLAAQSNQVSRDHKASLCVSELLDYALIGEGILPTLRDAWARLLLPGATVIPSRARLYAQLVGGGIAADYSSVQSAAHGLVLPVWAESTAVPLHAQELFSKGTVALSEGLVALEFDFRTAEALPPEAGREVSVSVEATGAGVVHGVLTWWELEIGSAGWYSTRHGQQDHWQDHWPQTLYPLDVESTLELDLEGSKRQVELVVAHTDQEVQFKLSRAGPPAAKKTKPDASSHVQVAPPRVLQFNDFQRLNSLRTGIEHALGARGKDACCLDVSNGPVAALLAASLGATCVTSLERSSDAAFGLAAKLCEANGVTDPECFRVTAVECTSQLQLEHVLGGPADIVMGEPYYERLDGWPIHQALNFFYTTRALKRRGLVRQDALVVPSSASVVACLVQFDGAQASYSPPEQVCGFDHQLFAQAARLDGHDLNLPMWQYKHQLLTTPIELARIELGSDELPARCSEWCYSEVVHTGRCDAVVMWLEYGNIGSDQLALRSMSDKQHQCVRMLRQPAVELSVGGTARVGLRFGFGVSSSDSLDDYELQIDIKK